MDSSQQQRFDEALAVSAARIGQLEREAIAREGDTEEDLRAHLDRYRSLVLAVGQVIWTHDSKGKMLGEQILWATYTGQTLEQYKHHGWLPSWPSSWRT